jgi:hypothetical protein
MSISLDAFRIQEIVVFAFDYCINAVFTPEITRFDYAYRYDIVDINENDY